MKRHYFNPPSARIGDVVPAELKEQAIWLLWREKPDEGKEKPKKVAYWANGRKRFGKLGRPEDVANLVTFDEALAAYHDAVGRYAGIGVALLCGLGIGALDLDNCIDAVGKPGSDLHVRHILRACKDCYIERSPSGRGLRVLGSTGGVPPITATGFEAYSQGLFVTVTGEVLRNAGAWEPIDAGVAAMSLAVQTKGGEFGKPAQDAGAKGVNLDSVPRDGVTRNGPRAHRRAELVSRAALQAG